MGNCCTRRLMWAPWDGAGHLRWKSWMARSTAQRGGGSQRTKPIRAGNAAASQRRFSRRRRFWWGRIFFIKTKSEKSTCERNGFPTFFFFSFSFCMLIAQSCGERKASTACCAHDSRLGFRAGSVPKWSFSFSVFLPLLSSEFRGFDGCFESRRACCRGG